MLSLEAGDRGVRLEVGGGKDGQCCVRSSINPANLWPAPESDAPNCSQFWRKAQGKDAGQKPSPCGGCEKKDPGGKRYRTVGGSVP